MTVRTSRLTIGATATQLTGTDDDYAAGSVIDVHAMAGTVYVGGPDVTAANGRPIAAGASLRLDLRYGETLFGVAAAATTADVAVLRSGV